MIENLTRITDPTDVRMEELITLYEEAFPESERRDIEQLKHLIRENPRMYFNAIEQEGKTVGLFVYWNLGDFYYLEHLAVFERERNLKIGECVLARVAERLEGTRLLEVEPPTDDMTMRRINFYRRNGYEVLDKNFVQPSYRENCDACHLWIMGNCQSERLPEYLELIKNAIYREHLRGRGDEERKNV